MQVMTRYDVETCSSLSHTPGSKELMLTLLCDAQAAIARPSCLARPCQVIITGAGRVPSRVRWVRTVTATQEGGHFHVSMALIPPVFCDSAVRRPRQQSPPEHIPRDVRTHAESLLLP